MSTPEIRYARSGDINIAYTDVGDGPPLVMTPGAVSNLEHSWEDERSARFRHRLAEFARLVLFDKRGTGLSDRAVGIADLETRMDDVRAVMDAAGIARATLLGISEGGPMTALFAATYPERVQGLIIYGALPRFTWAPDFPWAPPREESEREIAETERTWATRGLAEEQLREAGTEVTEAAVEAEMRRMRLGASPGAAAALVRMNLEIDVRHVLPSIRVPTAVLHRVEDHLPIDGARWMASMIPDARFVELPGGPHMAAYGDTESVVAAIREFFLDVNTREDTAHAEPERVLATVLFTDLVGSTARAVELGPRWRELLGEHNATIRRELSRYSGREIDTAGDGFFASGFDGPARAIRCGCAIRDAIGALGLDVRVGVHTGECELVDGKLAGLAVVIGARVAAQAETGEVLVSGTVKDLVAGSGIEFDARGARELKGLGEWPLYAVAAA